MRTLVIESAPRGVNWVFVTDFDEKSEAHRGNVLMRRRSNEVGNIWTSGDERLTAFDDEVLSIEEIWAGLLDRNSTDIQSKAALLIESISADIQKDDQIDRVVFAIPEATSELAQNSILAEISRRFLVSRNEVYLLWRSVAIALCDAEASGDGARKLVLDFGQHSLEGTTLQMSRVKGVLCPERDFQRKRISGIRHSESLRSWLNQNYRLEASSLDLVESGQGSAVYEGLVQDLNFDPPKLWKSSTLNYEPISILHDDFAKSANLEGIMDGLVSDLSILSSDDVVLWFGWPVYWSGEDRLRSQAPKSRLLENDAVLKGCLEFELRLRKGLPTYFELIPSYEIWCQSAELGMPKSWGWETLLKGDRFPGTETLKAVPNTRFQLNAGTREFDMNVRIEKSEQFRRVRQELPVKITKNEPIQINSEVRPTGGSVKFSISSMVNPDLFGQDAEVALRWERSADRNVSELIPPDLGTSKYSYPFIIQSEGDSSKRLVLESIAKSVSEGSKIDEFLLGLRDIIHPNLKLNGYVIPFGNRYVSSDLSDDLEYLVEQINRQSMWHIKNVKGSDRNSSKWVQIAGSLCCYASNDVQKALFEEVMRRDFPLSDARASSLFWAFGKTCRTSHYLEEYLNRAIAEWIYLDGMHYWLFWPFAKSLCYYGEPARIPRETAVSVYECASEMLGWLIKNRVPSDDKAFGKPNWKKWTLAAILFGLRIRELHPDFMSPKSGPEKERELATNIRKQLLNTKILSTPIPPLALKGIDNGTSTSTLGELVLKFLDAKADETDVKLAGGIGLSS